MVTEMKMLRRCQGLTLQDRVGNEDIRRKMGVPAIDRYLESKRLAWYGHVRRRPDEHITQVVFHLPIPGRRSRGRPPFTWKRVVDKDLERRGINHDSTLDRVQWNRNIRPIEKGLNRVFTQNQKLLIWTFYLQNTFQNASLNHLYIIH